MTRYAIYFVPAPQTPLAAFGAHAIGYDVAAGAEVPFHDDDAFRALGPAAWTGSPARYGFHATLKAPFALAEGVTEEGLEEAVSDLACAITPVCRSTSCLLLSIASMLARIDSFTRVTNSTTSRVASTDWTARWPISSATTLKPLP